MSLLSGVFSRKSVAFKSLAFLEVFSSFFAFFCFLFCFFFLSCSRSLGMPGTLSLETVSLSTAYSGLNTGLVALAFALGSAAGDTCSEVSTATFDTSGGVAGTCGRQ